MATIKAYTGLSQSKTLSKILPLESADMYWWSSGKRYYIEAMDDGDFNEEEGHVRAWSLAALLDILPKAINNETLFIETSPALWHIGYRNIYTARADNPVDACFELIIINKLNLL
ncbi:MAG: hypothetical protein IJ593_00155 [Lachnospiraceae bacterium]|nr:hypothetical protein [Lachnospiraceae bacterium]